jgi:hypothetical protein
MRHLRGRMIALALFWRFGLLYIETSHYASFIYPAAALPQDEGNENPGFAPGANSKRLLAIRLFGRPSSETRKTPMRTLVFLPYYDSSSMRLWPRLLAPISGVFRRVFESVLCLMTSQSYARERKKEALALADVLARFMPIGVANPKIIANKSASEAKAA